MKYDNLILFDWFSFTAKHHSEVSMIEVVLGMDVSMFEHTHGVRGYKDRLYYDGININYSPDREEVWCEMSGQGCRTYETYGFGKWHDLFHEVLSESNYHITRLDVAYDDHLGVLDLKRMAQHVHSGHVVSEFRRNGVQYEYTGNLEAITIYHGSKKSDVFFRIYDKAIERNRENEGHWVRFEIQMRDSHASNFLKKMIVENVGDVFAKTVNNYIRYVDPSEDDTNKRRWDTSVWWYNFIHTTGKISLYEAPGTEYNFDNLEKFVVDMAGAAVSTYVKLVGVDAFIEKCERKYRSTRNPKYQILMNRIAMMTVMDEIGTRTDG